MGTKFHSVDSAGSAASLRNIATNRPSVAARPTAEASDQSNIKPRMSAACSKMNRLRLPRRVSRSGEYSHLGGKLERRKMGIGRSLMLSRKSPNDMMPNAQADAPKHQRHISSAAGSSGSCHRAAKPSRKAEPALVRCATRHLLPVKASANSAGVSTSTSGSTTASERGANP